MVKKEFLPDWDNPQRVNNSNQFIPQAVLLKTRKVTLPTTRHQPTPTGKPDMPTPISTFRQYRPFQVPNASSNN